MIRFRFNSAGNSEAVEKYKGIYKKLVNPFRE